MRAIAKNDVLEFIEMYYNRKRVSSMIGYKWPDLFEVNKGRYARCPFFGARSFLTVPDLTDLLFERILTR